MPYDDWPSFSPDGKRIVYLRVSQADDQGNPTTGGYFVVDVAGGTSRRITADVSVPGPPRFSPDGRRVLFDRHTGEGGSSLWVIPVAGGDPAELFDVPSDGSAFNADWSPDGSQVVFEYYQQGEDRNELRIAALDGSGMRTIWRGTARTTAELPDWTE